MSIGAFNDKNYQPTDTEVSKAIGPMLKVWQVLVQFIRDNYPIQEDFKFMYGKKYGWALRFRINGKLLTSLYPNHNGFTVQIILAPAAIEQTQHIRLRKNTRQVIAKAHPYPEGRWLFIPVKSMNDVQDIHRLLAMKHEIRRVQKKSGHSSSKK